MTSIAISPTKSSDGYGRNKGFLGAASTSARLEERPLLSETEARLMNPDEVIILASPQHPIKAHRIKYYDDPLFKAMVEKQEGKPFPYPPSVEGVGPWGAEADMDEGQRMPQHEPVGDRSGRRESRGMRRMDVELTRNQPAPEDLERATLVPKDWGDELDRQEDFIDDLLGR